MKVLLIKDVYKLGHAGDIKKVADGYGRNYLLPQGLAVLATAGAIKQADQIRNKAAKERALLNEEMGELAKLVAGVEVVFAVKAGETGKLYGSITSQMIVDAINEKIDSKIDRRQLEIQPIRNLGEYKAVIRLTVDITPTVKVIVYREGDASPVQEKEPETQAVSQEISASEEA